jgi:hypothetical protein
MNIIKVKKTRYLGYSLHQPYLIRLRQTLHSYIKTHHKDTLTVHSAAQNKHNRTLQVCHSSQMC